MSKRKVYIFYRVPINEPAYMYGYTENEELASEFVCTRDMNQFVMRMQSIDDVIFRGFMSEHRMEMLFENVLCDASKSYQFVTTYGEDFEISSACDEFYDSFLEAQKDVLILPLTEELRAAVDFIAKDIKESLHSDTNPMGPYNTFNIFMRLFGDTVWHDD